MKTLFSPRTRAGMLLTALVLVGGTGCVTSTIMDRRPESWGEARAREKAHERHMAELTRAAEAGDPAAATSLSAALTATPDPGKIDPRRVTALLSSAAGRGYAPAQAALGEILAEERIRGSSYNHLPLPPGLRDRERGMQLLRQAATQACRYKPRPESLDHNSMNPATTLSHVLRDIGRSDEKRLWDARNAVHCDEPRGDELSRWIADKGNTPQSRTKWLALLLLKQDSQAIAKAEAAMPPEEVAAAHREAEQLRRQLAQSEQQYPAPTRKEM